MKTNRIVTALRLIRDLEYVKATILSQLENDLQEMIGDDKQKQKDEETTRTPCVVASGHAMPLHEA